MAKYVYEVTNTSPLTLRSQHRYAALSHLLSVSLFINQMLRINPAKDADTGTVEVDWIRVHDSAGKVVRVWEF